MDDEPKVRRVKHFKAHKCFGLHSRIVTAEMVEQGTTKGKRVGDKQIHPDNYHCGEAESRTKAEKLNAALRKS